MYAKRNETTNLPHTATDELLVMEAQSGDHLAFDELWARHFKKTFTLAYRIMRNHDDADDAVQDAWIKAYKHLNAFDRRSQFSTWLCRIAINSALGILRKRRARPETSMDIVDGEAWDHWEIADETKNIEELYVELETVECLRRAVIRLQPTLRNIVEIYNSNDHSLREIAELAGISVGATKSRMLRAKRILRRTVVAQSRTKSAPKFATTPLHPH